MLPSGRLRRDDYIGCTIAGVTLVIIVVGLVHLRAQTQILSLPQAAINAVLADRFDAMSLRVAKIEAQVNYALIGIIGNLITLIFILIQQSRKRTGK